MGVLSDLPTVDPGVRSYKTTNSPFSWLCSNVVGYLAPALLPPLHIGLFYFFWHQYSRHVDKRYCTCSCWDTVFKGEWDQFSCSFLRMTKWILWVFFSMPFQLIYIAFLFPGTYESGIASYKHLYFNATGNTLKIWCLTVGAVILLYECVRQLTFLGLRCRLRPSMTVLFLSSLFSHYYSW